MSKKQAIPYDVRQEVLWIVRGYERRVKEYHEARNQIINGSCCNNGIPGGSECGRSAENKAVKLEALENLPETKRMRAVDQAKRNIGMDLENEWMRQRLADGIMLNCESRHEYPFRYMNLTGISQTDFYRRKDGFLTEIAKFLCMI